MIIAFIIWTVVAFGFLMIGITARKSKEAIGFFTFVKPPKVKDIKRYNRSVSTLWFVFTVIFELMGVPLLFVKQNSAVVLLMVIGLMLLVIATMIVYTRIEIKYKQ